MATMTLMAQQARKTKAKPYNKKQAINAFVDKFKHTFDMKDDGIDLREMARNYNDMPIPVEDIHQAIVTVLGPKYHNITFGHDPSGGSYLGYANGRRPKEYFQPRPETRSPGIHQEVSRCSRRRRSKRIAESKSWIFCLPGQGWQR
jgi:hypothetical protein